MTSFGATTILDELHQRNRRAASEFKHIGDSLFAEQWNWKPGRDIWSIAQVVDHLLLTNNYYVDPLLHAVEAARKAPIQTFKSSWLGNLLVMRLEPESPKGKKPAKAPAFLQPKNSELDGPTLFNRFVKQLDQLELIITRAGAVDFSSIKIPLSFTKLLKLNIGDVLRLIIAHNDRHLLQMQRLKHQLINTPT